MQFYLFNICPRLHRRKWWKLCVTLFRIFSSSPAACWGCCSSNLNSETLLFTAKRCNLHIHTDFWSKFCLLYWMAPCWQAVWRIMFKIRVIYGERFERRKVDLKSKPTRKLKHANSILEYFEYFCQMSSKSILIILSYTVSKFARFFW